MSCCCGTNEKDAKDRVHGLLAGVGLRQVVEQTEDASRVMVQSIQQLEKADRAAALGFGQDVVDLHRSGGERSNRMCRRQFGAVVEAIDERVRRDDWKDVVARARSEYEAHEGRQALEDARADIRAALLDLETLPARSTGRIARMVDESFDRVADDGLDGGVQLLREHLDNALSALGAPEMGRQPGSPDMVAFYICEAATLAICAIAMVICLAAAFCWCCLWWAIYLACSINLGACAALAFV